MKKIRSQNINRHVQSTYQSANNPTNFKVSCFGGGGTTTFFAAVTMTLELTEVKSAATRLTTVLPLFTCDCVIATLACAATAQSKKMAILMIFTCFFSIIVASANDNSLRQSTNNSFNFIVLGGIFWRKGEKKKKVWRKTSS